MIRAFVAIPLPERVRAGLATTLEGLRSGRPVDEENLHLTLLFLGEQDDEALAEVHEQLSGIVEAGFELTLAGLGTFGSEQPRTLWLGVRAEPRLIALQKAVSRTVRKAGLDLPHRRFVPHVTLARFRQGEPVGEGFARFVSGHAGLTLPAFPVRRFSLLASTLRPKGAVYDELANYPLRPGGT